MPRLPRRMPRTDRRPMPGCLLPSLERLEDRLVPAGDLFGDVVIFGDSLSDVGNAFAATSHTVPASPPYFQGHFSNGPVHVEVLAEYLGESPLAPAFAAPGGNNYAVGGASVVVDGAPGSLSALAPKLPEQVGAYLFGNTPAADDLFVFLGGANDFFNDPFFDPAAVATALADTIEAVIGAGGQTFLVGNLPLLGDTPLFALNPMSAFFANQWTLGYNAALDTELDVLRLAHPGVTILEVDLQAFGEQAAAPDNPFGFTRGKLPIGDLDLATGLLVNVTTDDPDRHLYADSFHPSARAHQLVGVRGAAAVLTALGVDTLTVTNDSDVIDPLDGGISLREALALANEMEGEQTIRFDLGAGRHSIRLGGEALSITDDVSVVGLSLGRLTIDADGQSRVFDVAEGAIVSLSHLVLTGGRAEPGGAIHNAGQLTLSHVTFVSNAATGANAAGGAVYNTGSLTARASAFLGNAASGTESATGGAVANVGGDVTLIGVLLSGNVASGPLALGGAVANLNGGTAHVRYSTFLLNRAAGDVAMGGAIYNGPGSSLDLYYSLVSRNSATGEQGLGGGLYLAEGSDTDLFATLIKFNTASTRGKNVFRE